MHKSFFFSAVHLWYSEEDDEWRLTEEDFVNCKHSYAILPGLNSLTWGKRQWLINRNGTYHLDSKILVKVERNLDQGM